MPHKLAPVLRRRYLQLAKEFVTPLVKLLSVGRASCGGDLDKLLILLVVGLRTAEHRRTPELDFDQVLSGAVDVYPSLSTNVRSIADSTGIPKESVRRKVGALIEAGLIHREDNALSLAPETSRMLTEWREQLFELAIRYHRLLASLEAQDR
jgi:hypothetical protein